MLVSSAAPTATRTVFTDPDAFDVRRANRPSTSRFSAGIHYCLGAGLARLEAAVALPDALRALPGPARRRPAGASYDARAPGLRVPARLDARARAR